MIAFLLNNFFLDRSIFYLMSQSINFAAIYHQKNNINNDNVYIQKEKESTLVFKDYKKEKLDENIFNKESLEF